MLSGLEISSTRKHTRAWLRSRNLLMREPSSTLLLQIFPLKVSHPNYICQCSRVSPRGLVSPTSVVWVCWQTVSWHLIKSLQLISGAQPCHPERSEGSRCLSRQTLRGVYTERSECAQGDTGCLVKRSRTFLHIEPCLTMKNEERSLMPLVVISRQNTLVKEQEGGYDEHAWQHITDPCGYHPPVSSYIALCRPPRDPIDRHAAGRGNAHAPLRRLAHYDWYHHARWGHRFADRHHSHGCGLVGCLSAREPARHNRES